jgi:type IV pilus assembly protein PilC
MLREYRYFGIKKSTQKMVRGSIFEKSASQAKVKIGKLATEHGFSVQKIEPKRTFMYTAINPGGKKVKGEQDAFAKEEVQKALANVGFTRIQVQPMLVNFRFKPPFEDLVMFISLSADMLRENMKYDEILKIQQTDLTNKTLRDTVKSVARDLRQGQDGVSVFSKHADVFGKFTSYMLGLASKSGNMAEIYDSTAKYLTRQMEFRKNVKQALTMPGFTMLAIAGAVAYYIGKLFPEMTEMFLKFGMPLPPMTAATLKVSHALQANWWWLTLIFVLPLGFYFYWIHTPKGRLIKDKYILKIPVLGSLLHKMSIEIFFRVFSIIYSGSGNNIEVITISAEACGNTWMEKNVKENTIPRMLKEGAGLIEAIEAAGVFTETVVSRLNAGSATGSVKKAAAQIAIYYEKETGYKFKSLLSFIDILTAIIIMVVMMFLIIVSSESAFMHPKTAGM